MLDPNFSLSSEISNKLLNYPKNLNYDSGNYRLDKLIETRLPPDMLSLKNLTYSLDQLMGLPSLIADVVSNSNKQHFDVKKAVRSEIVKAKTSLCIDVKKHSLEAKSIEYSIGQSKTLEPILGRIFAITRSQPVIYF